MVNPCIVVLGAGTLGQTLPRAYTRCVTGVVLALLDLDATAFGVEVSGFSSTHDAEAVLQEGSGVDLGPHTALHPDGPGHTGGAVGPVLDVLASTLCPVATSVWATLCRLHPDFVRAHTPAVVTLLEVWVLL
jgi:hypothetical protein